MKKILKDFISEENREFKFKIGKILASALSGFIAGVIFTSIFLAVIITQIEHFPYILGK